VISERLIKVFLILSAIMTGVFAYLFAFAPQTGLDLTNHTVENLASVMAGRYLALSLFALAIAFLGDLTMAAAFFAIGMMLGFIDGYIYLSAGLPFIEHAVVGCLSAAALGLTLWLKKSKGLA